MSSAGLIAGGIGLAGSLLMGDNGAGEANSASADAARMQAQIAREQWDSYKKLYQPIEQGLAADAANYDSAENYAKAAGNAAATVSDQFSKARGTLSRTPGLDPSSAAYQAGMTGLGLNEAAVSAVQQNAARQGVQDTAYARKVNAVGLGKGIAANAQAGLSSAASTNMQLAQIANQQNASTAQGLGVIGGAIGKGVSGWLNKPTTTPVTTPTP